MSESGGFWGSDSADVGLNYEDKMKDKFRDIPAEPTPINNEVLTVEALTEEFLRRAERVIEDDFKYRMDNTTNVNGIHLHCIEALRKEFK